MSMSSSFAPAHEANSPAGLLVLLVEDDEADAYLINRALEDNPRVGKVVRAGDGETALAMIESGEISPDLALIDLRMPHMDGLDLLVAFATQPELDFPMVVLTSSSRRYDAVRSRLRSALRVIMKPDTVIELYAALTTAIEAACQPGARRNKTPAYLLLDTPASSSLRRATGDACGP
jgi:CheY-like chemotaxis protein